MTFEEIASIFSVIIFLALYVYIEKRVEIKKWYYSKLVRERQKRTQKYGSLFVQFNKFYNMSDRVNKRKTTRNNEWLYKKCYEYAIQHMGEIRCTKAYLKLQHSVMEPFSIIISISLVSITVISKIFSEAIVSKILNYTRVDVLHSGDGNLYEIYKFEQALLESVIFLLLVLGIIWMVSGMKRIILRYPYFISVLEDAEDSKEK